MKKTILLLTFFISTTCFAQKQKTDSSKNIRGTGEVVYPPEGNQNPPFYLLGTRNDFLILLMALTTPGDVTPNQIKQLVDWINQRAKQLPTDSIGNKK